MNKKFLKINIGIGIALLLIGTNVTATQTFQNKTISSTDSYWFDDFDSYEAGTPLHGQGGWAGWDNDPAVTGYITTDQAHSSPNSVEIKWFTNVAADMVHEYTDINSGTWIYRAWQYVPSTMTGTQFFILMNTYIVGNHQNPHWSLQLEFSATGGYIRDYNNQAASLPLKTNQWALIKVEIDFEADIQTVYYDNTFLTSKSWKNGVSQGGAKNLACVDLYAGDSASSSVYYDDLSVVPAGPPLTCDADGPYSGYAKKPIQFTGTASGGIEPYTWLWDFGDETTSNEQNPSHVYNEPGEYNVILTVTDAIHDVAYDYTTVSVGEVLAPELNIGKISGGIGISTNIRNLGNADATDVQWSISLTGFAFPKEKNGVIEKLEKSGQTKIKAIIFGFGKIDIKINATCAEGSTAEKTAKGSVFLLFTFGIS